VGFFVFLFAPEEVAQVVGEGGQAEAGLELAELGVVGGDVEGFAEPGFGAGEVALGDVGHGEVMHGEHVFGLDTEGGFGLLDALVDAAGEKKRDGEVVQGGGVAGGGGEDAVEGDFGGTELVDVHEEVAEFEEGFFLAGLLGEFAIGVEECFGRLVLAVVKLGDFQMGAGEGAIVAKNATELFEGGEEIAPSIYIVLHRQLTKVEMSGAFLGGEFEDLAEFFGGGGKLAHFDEEFAEVEHDVEVAGAGAKLFDEVLAGLGELAFGPVSIGDAGVDLGVIGVNFGDLLPAPEGAIEEPAGEKRVADVVVADGAAFLVLAGEEEHFLGFFVVAFFGVGDDAVAVAGFVGGIEGFDFLEEADGFIEVSGAVAVVAEGVEYLDVFGFHFESAAVGGDGFGKAIHGVVGEAEVEVP